MCKKEPLTESEQNLLAELLDRLEWPIPKAVFDVTVRKFVTTHVELAVFDRNGRILLIPRDDVEYPKCWHMPGTVLRNNENVPAALDRLTKTEIGISVSAPISLGWVEIVMGHGEAMNPTRHEISLLHRSDIQGSYSGVGKFFYLSDLPRGTLSHHRRLVAMAYAT